MSIRKRIIIYFSVAITLLLGMSHIFIYTLFAQYREGDFDQRQKNKIITTIHLLQHIRDVEEEILEGIDELKINAILDEKILIYNGQKKLIYSNLDNVPIYFTRDILNNLNPSNTWIDDSQGVYDVVGVYVEVNGKPYYGISKAHDYFGLDKLNFLKWVLVGSFLIISCILVLLSAWLAGKITHSIESITRQIDEYPIHAGAQPLPETGPDLELNILAAKFNLLMNKMNEAFSFQKHAVHHISHELRTPIAILVSNFERIEKEADTESLKLSIRQQKEDTKKLSEMLTVLLDIARVESGTVVQEPVRVDELIFDSGSDLALLYPEFQFSVEYSGTNVDDPNLSTLAQPRLLKSAFMNLMQNCIKYGKRQEAKIEIVSGKESLSIHFISWGNLIEPDELPFVFRHFFRGRNSIPSKGFGLGLVFTQKIVAHSGGSVSYSNDGKDQNIFTITLPVLKEK